MARTLQAPMGTAERIATQETSPTATPDEAVVLLLADIAPAHRWWGWSRVARGPGPLRGEPGLRFARALGSGHNGGFGLRPSGTRQGLFAVFERLRDAEDFVTASSTVRAYREHAREVLTLILRTTSCRGSWAGVALRPGAAAPSAGPVAALTRASIRPLRAAAFWRHSPASEAAVAQAPGCWLATGLGEAPLVRQATFSLWQDQAAMDAYARSGAHLDAIRAAAQGQWFSESMFARFVPLRVEGVWKGQCHG